jgi:hypothetical protein
MAEIDDGDEGPSVPDSAQAAGAKISDVDWKEYFAQTKALPPSPLLQQAARSVRSKTSALDLGSGGLKDSRFLLECGFERVVALDILLVAETVAARFPQERFT